MRLALSATLLAATVALAGCSGSVSIGDTTPTVAAADVETQILEQLKTPEGESPDTAECPEDLEGEVGTVLTCTITDADGELDVDVEVTSVEGTDVGFDITPVE